MLEDTSLSFVDAGARLGFSEIEAAIEQVHNATAYYTRSHVVDSLLQRAGWPAPGSLLCDPSAGDGAFLDSALSLLLEQYPGLDEAGVLSSIEGWEFHRGAVADARERIAGVLLARGWTHECAERTARAMIHHGDFLTGGPQRGQRYNFIVGNPPYLRSTKVPGVLQDAYRVVVPEVARYDLLHAFLEKCSDLLKPGGKIGMVISDRVLSTDNASGLRALLGKTLFVQDLERIEGESAFYRPKDRRAGTPPRVHPVILLLGTAPTKFVAPLDGSPIYPGVEDAPAGLPRLVDVATVRIAPWIGTRGCFHVTKDVAATLPQDYLVPVADGRDFTGGKFKGPSSFLIRTEGLDNIPGAIMDHLARTLPTMCKRGRRTPVHLPPEAWWDRYTQMADSPCLVVPRICRGFSAIRIPAGYLPVNHAVVLTHPKGLSLEELEMAILGPVTQRWVDGRAPRLENDYFFVGTTFARQVPLQMPTGA